MIYELYEMHDARDMQQVANIRYTSNQVSSQVQHTSFQPYSSYTWIQW